MVPYLGKLLERIKLLNTSNRNRRRGVHGGAFIVNGVAFDWGAFINAIINFVIVAAILYFFIVAPVNTLMARRRRGEAPVEAAAATPEDIALLREIRDLLKRETK